MFRIETVRRVFQRNVRKVGSTRDKLGTELGFRVGLSSWTIELNFRVGFSSWIFELDFRVGLSSWTFEFGSRVGLSSRKPRLM